VPGVRPHLFRHAWTHYMKANGAAEADMMKLVGWSSTKQLARYGTALAEQRAIAAGQAHQVVRIMKGR
jgi:integrase/recombinase XerC